MVSPLALLTLNVGIGGALLLDFQRTELQIGSTWGRQFVHIEHTNSWPESMKRAALSTVKVAGGTGLYLGRFGNQTIVATNHHVISKQQQCWLTYIQFDLLRLWYSCKKVLGSWPDIDLTILTIEDPKHQLEGLGVSFAFDTPLSKSTELVAFGHSGIENPGRNIQMITDDDCRIFSDTWKLLSDPDHNPIPYQVWSMAVGCDVAHGDSGAPVFQKSTGLAMGLIWTGKTPKVPRMQQDAHLDMLLDANDHEDTWNELNYAVPANIIYQRLSETLDTLQEETELKAVLQDLLL